MDNGGKEEKIIWTGKGGWQSCCSLTILPPYSVVLLPLPSSNHKKKKLRKGGRKENEEKNSRNICMYADDNNCRFCCREGK